MAAFTIAGLTIKEAIRRRTLLGSLCIGLLILGLSLILVWIRADMQRLVDSGARDKIWFATQYPVARSLITSICLTTIRILGSIFAILLAAGSIAGEIENGLLAVILSKPIPRWQIYLGKWLGLNAILAGSVLLWTALTWLSLTLQSGADLTPILGAALYLALFPVLIGTVTLSFSGFAQRLLGASLALSLSAFAWFDGIFNALGDNYGVDSLHKLANVAAIAMPQGCIAWWIENVMEDITYRDPRIPQIGESPQVIKEWGQAHLHHYAHLDAVYLFLYIGMAMALGIVLFQRRDV